MSAAPPPPQPIVNTSAPAIPVPLTSHSTTAVAAEVGIATHETAFQRYRKRKHRIRGAIDGVAADGMKNGVQGNAVTAAAVNGGGAASAAEVKPLSATNEMKESKPSMAVSEDEEEDDDHERILTEENIKYLLSKHIRSGQRQGQSEAGHCD